MYPSYVRLSRRPKKAEKTYKESKQQWVSKLNWTCYKTFPSNLSQTHLLQSHSMLKSLFTTQKRSLWTQAFLLQKPALLKLSTSFYFSLFHFSLYTISTQIDPVEYNFFFWPPGASIALSCLPGAVFIISCSSFISYPERMEWETVMFKRQR